MLMIELCWKNRDKAIVFDNGNFEDGTYKLLAMVELNGEAERFKYRLDSSLVGPLGLATMDKMLEDLPAVAMPAPAAFLWYTGPLDLYHTIEQAPAVKFGEMRFRGEYSSVAGVGSNVNLTGAGVSPAGQPISFTNLSDPSHQEDLGISNLTAKPPTGENIDMSYPLRWSIEEEGQSVTPKIYVALIYNALRTSVWVQAVQRLCNKIWKNRSTHTLASYDAYSLSVTLFRGQQEDHAVTFFDVSRALRGLTGNPHAMRTSLGKVNVTFDVRDERGRQVPAFLQITIEQTMVAGLSNGTLVGSGNETELATIEHQFKGSDDPAAGKIMDVT